MFNPKKTWIPSILICISACSSAFAQLPPSESDTKGTEDFRRTTPSGLYIDPSSFFRFHGYISLIHASSGNELGTETGGTPQILIAGVSPRSGQNESGFRSDAALFVGGEPFEGVGTVMEIHFVGDASDPVITEAKVTWDLLGNDSSRYTLRSAFGRFWWPFGIHNSEWFSALNHFSLLSPAATEVIPAHYNEVGVLAEGELRFSRYWGANYLISVGNGVPGFGLMPNVRATQFDDNDNRSFTSRVALVLKQGIKAELGFSSATGDLRSGLDTSLQVSNPNRYEASFTASGLDLSISGFGFGLRSYFYQSEEKLQGAPVNKLVRDGLTLEPSYTWSLQSSRINSIALITRYAHAEEERLMSTPGVQNLRRLQYGVATVLTIRNGLKFKVSYIHQREAEQLNNADNDAFTLGFTGQF